MPSSRDSYKARVHAGQARGESPAGTRPQISPEAHRTDGAQAGVFLRRLVATASVSPRKRGQVHALRVLCPPTAGILPGAG